MNVFLKVSNPCPTSHRDLIRIKNMPGFNQVSDPARADVIIAFLCAMTAEEIAAAKAIIPELVNAKKENPNIKLIIGGCVNGIFHIKEEYPDVDEVFGRSGMAETVARALGIAMNSQELAVEVHDGGVAEIVIAYGCLRHCAFCKTGYLPDMELRSVPKEQIFAEIAEAVKQGTRYINICGENVSEWGIDIWGEPKLLSLLKEILQKFPEIKLMDVCGICLDEMTPKLLKFLVRTPEINIVQAEVQSFIPEVRKAMNLTKSADEVKHIIKELSAKKPIQGNVISGHSPETAEAFRKELGYIKQQKLYMLDPCYFINTEGTLSSRLEQIPKDTQKTRFSMLSKVLLELRAERADELVRYGKMGNTLPARVVAVREDHSLLMLSREPIVVEVSDVLRVGDSVNCRITDCISLVSIKNNIIQMKGTIG